FYLLSLSCLGQIQTSSGNRAPSSCRNCSDPRSPCTSSFGRGYVSRNLGWICQNLDEESPRFQGPGSVPCHPRVRLVLPATWRWTNHEAPQVPTATAHIYTNTLKK
uniref:Uncharacterized protein n=1 Tax=Denticeps clupeoides TaxID=299321 RepID=A0AAY4DAS3_9TELE